jgi:hypothetical protein
MADGWVELAGVASPGFTTWQSRRTTSCGANQKINNIKALNGGGLLGYELVLIVKMKATRACEIFLSIFPTVQCDEI